MSATPALVAGVVTFVGFRGVQVLAARARRVGASARVLARAETGSASGSRASHLKAWLAAQVRASGLAVTPEQAWSAWLGTAGVAAVLAVALGGPFLGGVAVAGVAALPPVAFGVLRRRRATSYDDALIAALDALARSIRSGASLSQAVREAATAVPGPVGADLSRVSSSVGRGVTLEAALRDWVARNDRPAVRLAVGALGLASQTGGPPARVVEDVATALRGRQHLEREAVALAAQAKLSAVVVGVAPIGFALLACVVDRRNAHLLFGTPIGIGCVTVGLALDAVGALWMRRISASVLG